MPRRVVPTLLVAEPLLARVVERAVVGKYQVRARADEDAFGRDRQTLLGEAVGLLEEGFRVNDHAVAEHAGLARVDDARRERWRTKERVADLTEWPALWPP